MANPLRGEVVRLYKNVSGTVTENPPLWTDGKPKTLKFKAKTVGINDELLYLGREYPKGGEYFRDRLRSAFSKNKSVQDQEQIKALIARGEFVARELEALYYLRKYRAMKKRYYDE